MYDINRIIAASVFPVFLWALSVKYDLRKCTRREVSDSKKKSCILKKYRLHMQETIVTNNSRKAKILLLGQIELDKYTMCALKSPYKHVFLIHRTNGLCLLILI